jgi:hypothetical protein
MLDYTSDRVHSLVVNLLAFRNGFLLLLNSELEELLLLTQVLLYASTVVAGEELLRTVERSAAIIVREDLEVGVNDVVISIDIHRGVVAYDAVGSCFIEWPFIVWRFHRHFVFIQVLIHLMHHGVRRLQNVILHWLLRIS